MLCEYCGRYTLCLVGWRRFLTQLRPSVGFSCCNKVCACSQFSALLHLTSPQVRTRLTEFHTNHGVSRSRYPGQRSRGARPGKRDNAASSRCHDGSRGPNHGPLEETGSLSSASTSPTGVTSTRPVRVQSPVGCVSPFPGSVMGRQHSVRGSFYNWTFTWPPFTQLLREGRECPPSSHATSVWGEGDAALDHFEEFTASGPSSTICPKGEWRGNGSSI